MYDEEIIKKINKILDNLQLVPENKDVMALQLIENKKVFISPSANYYLSSDNDYQLYQSIISDIWYNLSNKAIENIYANFLEKKFNELLIEYKIKNLYLNKQLLENFEKSFQNLKSYSYSLATKIYGIYIKEPVLNIGNYMLCNYQFFKNVYSVENKITDLFFREEPTGAIDDCFIIHKNIYAIDRVKAKFIFFKKIEKFINCTLYCCSNHTENNYKISYINNHSLSKVIVKDNTNDIVQCVNENNSLFNPIYDLSENFLKHQYNEYFYNLLDKDNLSKLEEKLKIAVDWIGQSYRIPSLQQKFMFLCISLETLLTPSKTSIFESGIIHKLSLTTAILMGKDTNDKQRILALIKKLYSKRCAISHRGYSSDLCMKDYFDLLEILYPLTKKICELIIEKDIKSQEELDNYVQNMILSVSV